MGAGHAVRSWYFSCYSNEPLHRSVLFLLLGQSTSSREHQLLQEADSRQSHASQTILLHHTRSHITSIARPDHEIDSSSSRLQAYTTTHQDHPERPRPLQNHGDPGSHRPEPEPAPWSLRRLLGNEPVLRIHRHQEHQHQLRRRRQPDGTTEGAHRICIGCAFLLPSLLPIPSTQCHHPVYFSSSSLRTRADPRPTLPPGAKRNSSSAATRPSSTSASGSPRPPSRTP